MIKTKTAGLKDLDKVLEIENECFTVDAYPSKEWEYLLTEPGFTTLLAVYDGKAGGAITFHIKANEDITLLHLISIGIMKKYRRKGLGRYLMDEFIKVAQEKPPYILMAETRVSNTPMQKLLEEKGFRAVKKLPLYYSDEDGLLYLRAAEIKNS